MQTNSSKKKSKSIIIDGDLHYKFKVRCKGRNQKIGGVIEDLITIYLERPKAIQDIIEDVKTNSQSLN